MEKGNHILYRCPRHPKIPLKGRNAKCEMVCGDVMKCGHKCQSKCHPRRKGFHPPCKQPVEQECELCDQISDRRCDLPFVCRQTVTITRECGHEVDVLCSNRRNTNCKSACSRKMNCGHVCPRLCYQACTEEKDCQVCQPEEQERIALELAVTGKFHPASSTAPPSFPKTIDSFFDCRQHTVELTEVSRIECSAKSQRNFLEVVSQLNHFGGQDFIYVVLPLPRTFFYSRTEQLLTNHVELFENLRLNTVYQKFPISSNEKSPEMQVLIGKFHVGRAQNIKSNSTNVKLRDGLDDCLFAEDTTAYTEWKTTAFLPVWFVTVRIENKLFAKPTYWIKEVNNREIIYPVKLEYNLLKKLQKFCLQECRCGSGKDGNPFAFLNANTWRLFRIQNEKLWKKYRGKRKRLILKNGNKKLKSIGASVGTFPTLDLLRNGLEVGGAPDSSVNEVYLFHGTNKETAEIVCREGFDDRIAGEGMYFTNAPCNAAQYAQNRMFISRVLLCNIQGVQHFSRCIQLEHPHDSLSGYASLDTHREFIVFNRASTYPEYLLEFDSE